MSDGRGMRTCGTLALAARVAASRFASRRGNARGPRDAWLPIALRWRHKGRRPENVRARRAATAARTVWLPQFHLHFNARVTDRPRRGALPGFLPAATIHEAQRIVFNRYWTSVRAATLATHPRRAYRSPRGLHAGKAAVPRVHASVPAAARSCWPPIAPPIAPRLAYRPRRPLFERTRESVRAGTSRNERTQPFGVHTRLRPRELEAFRARPVALLNAASRHLHESTAPVVRLDRSLELVWRAALRRAAGVAVEGPRADLPAPSRRASARSFPGQETAPKAPARDERTAVMRVTNLDPGFVDRLTDDVIRRVERRVRIERERRGI